MRKQFNQNTELKNKLNEFKNKFGYIDENKIEEFLNAVFNLISKDYMEDI